MPRQNRVTPLGELIADPARGLVFGNRGCLHDEHGRIRRRWNGKRWIACRLEFGDRHRRELMQPGRYTELFFLDEATAFAAGHRPCSECRNGDYRRFKERWQSLHRGDSNFTAIDARLHAERLAGRSGLRRHHEAIVDDLPEGTFVVDDDTVWLVVGDGLRRWTPAGYADAVERHSGMEVSVVTPRTVVEVLRDGWQGSVPLLHPTALA